MKQTYILTYHIGGNFQERKLSRIVENTIFAKKTYVNSHKSTKFVKVFSIEIFLLYSSCCITTQLTCALISSAYIADPI